MNIGTPPTQTSGTSSGRTLKFGLPAECASSIELRALDAQARRFQPRHHIVDRLWVARFAFDLDHRVLGWKPGEDAAVIDLDDVDAGLVNLGGDRRERARLIVRGDVQPGDPALTDEVADQH